MKIFGISIGKSSPKPLTQAPPGPVGDLQLELANQALELAYELGERLDFTHSSIEKVERLLGIISDQFHRSRDATGLNGIAFQFGAYIACTIQHTTGKGVLLRDHPELGSGTFPFELGDTTIFPFAWCQKRIVDGAGDNVSKKYQILVMEGLGAGV